MTTSPLPQTVLCYVLCVVQDSLYNCSMVHMTILHDVVTVPTYSVLVSFYLAVSKALFANSPLDGTARHPPVNHPDNENVPTDSLLR